ncbi:hypothetical protein ACFSO7_01135 [Bacillus sp. CGMCC 1.16607]|uniref:hypothetical protein n=1 Tax=Bacillus sp. CGMCC 1.16607 TaxID=3351842 RepID=UPI003644BEF3
MSARIKSVMPLLDHESICRALDIMGESYRNNNNQITINSRSRYMRATLTKGPDGKYILTGDSDDLTSGFKSRLIEEYKKAYNQKLVKIKEEIARQEILRKKQIENELRRKLENEKRMEIEKRRNEEQKRLFDQRQLEELARTKSSEQAIQNTHVSIEDAQIEFNIKKLEEEKRLLEEEKKQYVDSQKQKIYDKARKLGYSIKETEEQGSVKLMLVKRTY